MSDKILNAKPTGRQKTKKSRQAGFKTKKKKKMGWL